MVTAQRRGRPADGYHQLGRAVAELNAAVRDGRDRVEVFDMICAHARALTGALAATAMTIDQDSQLLVRAAAGRAPPWQRGARIPIDDTLAGNALRRRGPVSVGLGKGGYPDSRFRFEQALPAAGVRQVVYLPIPGYGSVTGVLGAGYRRSAPLTARETSLLEPLASVAGLVPLEPTVPGDVSGLAGTVARDPGGLAERLEALVERVVTLSEAADCALYLADGRLGLTPVAVAVGSHRRAGGLPADGGPYRGGIPAGAAGGPADPVTVAQLLAERRPSTLWHLPGGALLCVPLPASGAVLGALCARWPEDGQPSPAERMLVNLTAGEAAYVVDSSRRRAVAEERAAAGERERLARELHDSVVQTFYSIGLGASTAAELLRRDPRQAKASIIWIQETATAGLSELRGLLLRLRPEALAGDEVTTALARLVDTLHRLPGCRVSAQLGPEPDASSEVRQALYRIAQEAIQNATRHARADQVTVRLRSEDGYVVLEVADDGQGFTPGTGFPGRLGIRSMRERAEGAGGRLEVVSAPGTGTVVRAVLPAGI